MAVKQPFAVFDIDGTLFRWQLFSEVVFELIAQGHIPQNTKKAIDEKLAGWRARSHRHAYRDYETALVEAFRPHVAGLKKRALEDAADAIVKTSGDHVYAYTRDLIRRLKKEGYTLIALSGSHDPIVQRFARKWDFDIALGQVFDDDGTHLTGTIPGDTLVVMQKGTLLKRIVAKHELSWQGSIAVGDSLSDASMLKLVEYPIAFNPTDDLFEEAKKHGWKVVIERKNMTYELEQRDGTYLLAKAASR